MVYYVFSIKMYRFNKTGSLVASGVNVFVSPEKGNIRGKKKIQGKVCKKTCKAYFAVKKRIGYLQYRASW